MGADVAARSAAEHQLRDRVAAAAQPAGAVTARIDSFPFLGRLVALGMVSRVQVSAADTALANWQALAAGWERLGAKDVGVLNTALRRAGNRTLRTDLAPPHDAEQADLE